MSMTDPTITAARLNALKSWLITMRVMDARLSELYQIVGVQPDAPLPSAIGDLQMLATKQVASLVGDTHGVDWCEWFWLENAYGAKQHEVKVGDDRFNVRTIDDLLLAIERHDHLVRASECHTDRGGAG